MTPPRRERINFVFGLDADGNIEKLMSLKRHHAGRRGEFLWEITNNTGDTIEEVTLSNFSPDPGPYLEFPNGMSARKIGVKGSGLIKATVKKVDPDTVRFTYQVRVDGQMTDPELEIDGDGGHVPPANKAGRKHAGGKKR